MSDNQFDREQNEPLFVALGKDDPELARCRERARTSVEIFCRLHDQHRENLGVYFAFKVRVLDGDDAAYLWYSLTSHSGGKLYGEHFELLKELAAHGSACVPRGEIEDWMISDHGVLYGGFSIRYQRSVTPEAERESFDNYVGVKRYEELA